MSAKELGPVSQAILEYVQERHGYIQIYPLISTVWIMTGQRHAPKWYFRRLVALALDGLIEANVYRGDDDYVNIRFRKLKDNGLGDLPRIEDADA